MASQMPTTIMMLLLLSSHSPTVAAATAPQAMSLDGSDMQMLRIHASSGAGGENLGTGTAALNLSAEVVAKDVRTGAYGRPRVIAGGYHTGLIKHDGTLWTCGQGTYGATGDGTKDKRNILTQVYSGVQTAVFGGSMLMVVDADGDVWSVGSGKYGKLGNGGTDDTLAFVKTFSGAQAVSAGSDAPNDHSIVLGSDGKVWTAGRNSHKQLGLGDGSTDDKSTYNHVLSDGQAIANGYFHSLVLKSDGTVWAAGRKDGLGDNSGSDRDEFQEVFSDAQAVSGGHYQTAVLKSDGTVWTTGTNSHGTLGDGTNSHRYTFQEVAGGVTDLPAPAGSGEHIEIIKDGTLYLTGRNTHGQLGDGTKTDVWTFKLTLSDVQDAVSGTLHTVALKRDGTLWAWGYGLNGNLADGTFGDKSSPVEVMSGLAPPPTGSPTAAPTANPAAASSVGAQPASAKGDPHLQNINGQRFDLMRPGRHVLIHIPRGADVPHILFRVVAEVQRLGPQCGDMYFQHVNVTGAWVEAKHKGILHFHAGENGGEEEPTWMAFGSVQLKVVRVHWQGIHYLNLFAKHLGQTGFTVGGLLGEDDHTNQATPDQDCIPKLNLYGTMGLDSTPPSKHSASSAEASLA